MDFIDMIMLAAGCSLKKESDKEEFEKLSNEAENDVVTLNRKEFTHIMSALCAYFMHEDPKTGMALIKTAPIIVAGVFEDDLRNRLAKIGKEDK